MKKLSILFASVAIMSNLAAQRNTTFQGHLFGVDTRLPQIQFDTKKAAGDTLFYFDGRYIKGKGISASSIPPFNDSLQDLDQLTINANYTAKGFPAKASYFLSADSNSPVDSNFYLVTTSYFTITGTAATANDWISFGPIAIPAAGATLYWKHSYFDDIFRDGYKVLVNTVGLGAAKFTGAPIYTIADNDVATKSDTSSAHVSVFFPKYTSLIAYAGQSIYLGFHHTAVDMDMLFLDDVLIKENLVEGIEINNTSEAITIYPNPSAGLFTINTGTTSKTHVEVYDRLGEVVYSKDSITATTSIDLTDLSAGVYSLRVISAHNKIIVKEVVITK